MNLVVNQNQIDHSTILATLIIITQAAHLCANVFFEDDKWVNLWYCFFKLVILQSVFTFIFSNLALAGSNYFMYLQRFFMVNVNVLILIDLNAANNLRVEVELHSYSSAANYRMYWKDKALQLAKMSWIPYRTKFRLTKYFVGQIFRHQFSYILIRQLIKGLSPN